MSGIDVGIRSSEAAYQSTHWLVLQYAECTCGVDVIGRRVYIFIDIGNGNCKSLRISQITIIRCRDHNFIDIIGIRIRRIFIIGCRIK